MKTIAWILWGGMSAVALLSVMQLAHARDALPVNPDVTQDNIKSTVCVPGWTAKIRPPVSYTNKIKFSKMDANGIARTRSAEIELDHVASIELGGSPTDPRNLRLQFWYGDDVPTPTDADGVDSQAHAKDVLETFLKRQICDGKMPLADAQSCILNDWRACAKSFGLPTSKPAP